MKSVVAILFIFASLSFPCFADKVPTADERTQIEKQIDLREREAREIEAARHGIPVEQLDSQWEKERAEIARKEQALRDGTLSAATPLKAWTADASGTNDVHVMVCTDAADTVGLGGVDTLAFREFVFSADGRLKSISPVKVLKDVAH